MFRRQPLRFHEDTENVIVSDQEFGYTTVSAGLFGPGSFSCLSRATYTYLSLEVYLLTLSSKKFYEVFSGPVGPDSLHLDNIQPLPRDITFFPRGLDTLQICVTVPVCVHSSRTWCPMFRHALKLELRLSSYDGSGPL